MFRYLVTTLVVATVMGCTPSPWLRTLPRAPATGLYLPEAEEARRLREDASADHHLRAAAWLHGALPYLPPAVTTPAPEARTWLTQASELEPQGGGAGEVARSLLALLATWESQRDAQQTAARATAKAEAARAQLTRKIRALEQEMDRLKAIDLAPLPAEDTDE